MRSNFLESEWAERIPEEIELSIETVIDGIAVRGRIDAVFPRDDGGWTVVDWKTGAQPAEQDAECGRSSSRRTHSPSLGSAASTPASWTPPSSTLPRVTVRPAVPDERILVAMLSTIPD